MDQTVRNQRPSGIGAKDPVEPGERQETETAGGLTREVAPHISPLPREKEEIHISEPSLVPVNVLTTPIIPFNP